MTNSPAQVFAGKKGLITGIANDQSIAYGCAKAFRLRGAELAVTYLNDKAKPYVEPLARDLEAPIVMPLDVRTDGALESVFEHMANTWGVLDFVVHSMAFAPFIRMARLAEPLMTRGGALFTMSFYGAHKVVEHYNLMGPVKAALEATSRYLACELGPKGIRVHTISPGPLRTRAASGISHFDELLEEAAAKAPVRQLVTIDDVGIAVAALATDSARLITGDTIYIDGGLHILS